MPFRPRQPTEESLRKFFLLVDLASLRFDIEQKRFELTSLDLEAPTVGAELAAVLGGNLTPGNPLAHAKPVTDLNREAVLLALRDSELRYRQARRFYLELLRAERSSST